MKIAACFIKSEEYKLDYNKKGMQLISSFPKFLSSKRNIHLRKYLCHAIFLGDLILIEIFFMIELILENDPNSLKIVIDDELKKKNLFCLIFFVSLSKKMT